MELTPSQHRAALAHIETAARLRRNRTAAKQEELNAELQSLAAAHKDLSARAHEVREARAAAVTADAEVQQRADEKRAKTARMEERLASGEGLTSRDLLALQNDIERAKAALQQCEEEQLEAMLAIEACDAELAELTSQAADIAERGRAFQAQREDERARLEAEHAELTAEAARHLAELPDKLRAAAAEAGLGCIVAGACGVCGAQLSGRRLEALKQAGPLSVSFCEECEAALVLPAPQD